jgi:hypothetical protein
MSTNNLPATVKTVTVKPAELNKPGSANFHNQKDLPIGVMSTIIGQGRIEELDDRNLMRALHYYHDGFKMAVAANEGVNSAQVGALATCMKALQLECQKRGVKGMSAEAAKRINLLVIKQNAWTKEEVTKKIDGETKVVRNMTKVKVNGEYVLRDAGEVERERREARLEKELKKAAKDNGEKVEGKKDRELREAKEKAATLEARLAALEAALKGQLMSEGVDEEEATALVRQEQSFATGQVIEV